MSAVTPDGARDVACCEMFACGTLACRMLRLMASSRDSIARGAPVSRNRTYGGLCVQVSFAPLRGADVRSCHPPHHEHSIGALMRKAHRLFVGLSAVSMVSTAAVAQNPTTPQAPAAPMTFFVTSVGKGDG